MTREEFDVLIRRLEEVSQKNPRLFMARVIGLVLLAYGYLALILFGSLALCLFMVVLVFYVPALIKLTLIGVIGFGGIFIAVARGMWVKMEPPKGQRVTRADVPQLFTLLDELRGALRCKPFHEVLLIGDYNAAVVQVPRLGIFGWHKNYLLIGLPLMQGLSPDEFKAVLAHEFAHSSRGHGRFSNWLYRVRRTWDQIFQQMIRQRSRFGFALFKFVNWFWPIFNGHAFVLARANEYEADACSVRLAGVNAAATALMRLPVDGSLLREKFWPNIYERAAIEKEPPTNVMLAFGNAVKSGPAAEDANRWLRQAFLLETNNADTHPCLKDRLRAIGSLPAGVERGEFPSAPPPPAETAADAFLGNHAAVVTQRMSEEWRKAIQKQWAERHEQTKKISEELAKFEQPSDAPPSAEQLWEKARKLIELKGDDGALPVLEQLLTLDPKHAAANFFMGRYYLQKDDPRGITFIENAIETDPLATPNGCNLLYGYFARTGQRDKLRPLEHRVDKFQEVAALAQRERAQMAAYDTFLAHGLTEQQIAELKKVFAAEPDIGSAAVAQKRVQHFPKSLCFAVAIRLNVSWLKPRSTAANQQLVRRVLPNIKLPGNFLVFVEEGNLKGLSKKVFSVPGTTVYCRDR